MVKISKILILIFIISGLVGFGLAGQIFHGSAQEVKPLEVAEKKLLKIIDKDKNKIFDNLEELLKAQPDEAFFNTIILFEGAVADAGSYGLIGEWQVNFHNVNKEGFDKSKFHTTSITNLNFYTGATCVAMNFTAIGEWNHIPGYKMIFRAGDSGEPGIDDTARVQLFDPSRTPIYDTHSDGEFTNESNCVGTARTGLDNGNIKIEF